MTTPGLEHEPDPVQSFDGTTIAARKMGVGPAPPLLVVNAVAANLAVWRRALIDLAGERTVVTWDHRGLHDSGPPVSGRVDPRAHAEDAIACLDHYDIDRFVMASWSNGSRIALEIAHAYPERLAALAIVSGGHGHPLGRLLRLELGSALPAIASIAKHFAKPLEASFRRIVARPELTGLIRQSGMVGATADTAALIDLVQGMADCDLRILLESFEAVAGDGAPELLHAIEAPTLVIAGDRDQFVSPAMTEEMARGIPNVRVETYAGATHYLPLEFPARLSDDLRKHFAEVA